MRKFSFAIPRNEHERAGMVERMAQLRAERDAGTISNRQFKYEYGAMASALWGPDFFRKARAGVRQVNQVSEGGSSVQAQV